MDHTEKFCSTITYALLHKTLIRGTFLSLLGIFLFYVGNCLSPETLNSLGIFILIGGLALITWGLYPYRRLSKLQIFPNELYLNTTSLYFADRGKQTLSIPLSSILKFSYLEKKNSYGIAIWLKRPIPKKISVLNPNFNFSSFHRNSQKRFNCDLFLPYFNQNCFEKLQSTTLHHK